ncbi:MAG: hypothetical protein RBS11_09375 [Sulfurimonas sp.]|jgi:hypothetical protein|nr:hypothetical protein [Sulfurimonas sp.]
MSKNLYTTKTPKVLLSLFALLVFFALETLYIFSTKSLDSESLEKRKELVSIIALPDLAISTEATFIRHRSMSDLFSIYKDDGSLREYFVSTYTYSHSHKAEKSAK